MLFPDYFAEQDKEKAYKKALSQVNNYKLAFQQNPEIVNNIQQIAEQYPALPTDVVVAMGINNINPNFQAVGEIEDELVKNKIRKEAELWTELYEKYQPENLEQNMKMSIWDLATAGFAPGGAKPFDVQYGVWTFAALDALFQTFSLGGSGKYSVLAPLANALVPGQIATVGRSQAYARDLRQFDKLIQDGYTPQQAQDMLQVDVSWTEVENIGKDTNLIEDFKKHIDIIKEAHKMGGEPLLANMFRQVLAGKPVNFDRGTKVTVESVDATKTPIYRDLIEEYGYSEEEAKKFIYNNIGTPIKQFDTDGNIHYTSAYNPNKINFYAGRNKQRYFFAGQTNQDYYRPDWAKSNELLEYSPGKVVAADFYAPGTVAFNTLSGTLDAVNQIIPELVGGKGLRGLRNLRKGFRGINKAFEATELGLVKQTGKSVKINPRAIADDVVETTAKEADALTGTGNFDNLVDYTTNTLKKHNTDIVADRKQTKKAAKKLKKEYTLFGRVPRFFQVTKDEILNQGQMQGFFNALAKTDESVEFAVATNNKLKNLHPLVIEEIIKETNPAKIQKIFSDMMDEGYVVKATSSNNLTSDLLQTLDTVSDGLLPVKGSFTLSKLSRNLAETGSRLQKKGTISSRALGRVASTFGNENASYRSFGNMVGQNLKKLRQVKPINKNDTIIDRTTAAGEMIKKQKLVDDLDPTYGKLEFEKYLGFSSSFNASYNPAYRKMLGMVPYLGISLNNFASGYKQLGAHLQIVGHDMETASKQLQKFRKLDFSNKGSIRDFAYDQMKVDLDLVKAKEKDGEVLAQIVEQTFEGLKKSKIYALAKNKETLPTVGSRGTVVTLRNPKDGKAVNMEHVTAHLFSEMSDDVVPLLDYKAINRAMGKVFRADASEEALTGAAGFVYDAKQYAKFKFGAIDDNPFENGIINTKKLTDDTFSKLANYYTRNVFKPMVLLRAAFFTRVFMEEQARIAMKGLDGLYNHPFRYIQWLSAHNPKDPWFLSLRKLPGIKKANADGVELLSSQEAMKAAQQTFLSSDFLGKVKYNRDAKGLEYYAETKADLANNLPKYVSGAFTELIMLRNDEISRQVAKLRYGSDELKTWINSDAGFKARRNLYDYGGQDYKKILDDADFIDQYLQSIEARIRIKTGGNVVKGKDYRKIPNSQEYRYNITSSDNGNANLRYAIAEGRLFADDFDITNAAKATKKDYLDFSENPEETIKFFKKRAVTDRLSKYLNSDGLDLDVGAVKFPEDINDKSILEGLDNAFDFVFEHLMTKPIGYLNRSTAFKQFRWQFVGNRFKDLDKSLRKKYIKEAIDAAVPKSVIEELKSLDALYPSGKIKDFTLFDNQSKAFGLSGVQQLLYDTTQRHALSDKVANIFPFAEVWFEVFQTWGKILAENPAAVRQGHVVIRGLGGADSLGSSSDDGFFSPAPGNPDEEKFIYPFGGFLTDSIFGDDSDVRISPRGYVTGINLLGQGFVPGPNPVVAFAVNKVLPENDIGDEIRETLFGTFPPAEKITDLVDPTQQVSASYRKLFAWVQRTKEFEQIDDSSSESEKARANATIDIFRYGMAAGQHNKLYDAGKLDKYLDKLFPGQWSADTITKRQIADAYLEYSKLASGRLFGYQFITQFFGPTGFQPQYFIKDDVGNLWGESVLYQEYIRIRDKNDGEPVATYNEFLQLYGFEHPWITVRDVETEGPRQPYTRASEKWKRENLDIYEILPKGTAYYLNVDNPFDERSFSDIVRGKQQMTPKQAQESINDTIGYLRYKTFSENVEELELPKVQEDILKRTYKNELVENLPGYLRDPDGTLTSASSLEKYEEMKRVWINKTETGYSVNPILADQEAAQGLAVFQPFWDEAERLSKIYSPGKNPDWWLSSTTPEARTMRVWIYNKANQIIQEYPEFYNVWQGVMLKLYRDDYEYLDYISES
jgi:hypothetical protein